jgi:hypothetical protein
VGSVVEDATPADERPDGGRNSGSSLALASRVWKLQFPSADGVVTGSTLYGFDGDSVGSEA